MFCLVFLTRICAKFLEKNISISERRTKLHCTTRMTYLKSVEVFIHSEGLSLALRGLGLRGGPIPAARPRRRSRGDDHAAPRLSILTKQFQIRRFMFECFLSAIPLMNSSLITLFDVSATFLKTTQKFQLVQSTQNRFTKVQLNKDCVCWCLKTEFTF